MTRRTALFTLGALGLLVTAWVLVLAAAKMRAGAMTALDLGIYTQVAWLTAHGHWFGFTIHPHSYLGDHVELLFAFAAIFFRFSAGALTLIGLQCAAVVGAAFALFAFGRRYVTTTYAWVFAALFLLNPFTLNALTFEFHAVLFGLPFAFLAATAYTDKRLGRFWLWAVLLLLAREDWAMLVAGFALLALLERRPTRWWLWPGLAAVGWYVSAGVLAGAINGEGYKFLNLFQPESVHASTLGAGVLGIFQVGNLLVGATLLLSVLALPLFAWRWLVLIILPLIGIGLAGIGSGDLILQTHYAAFFLPGLFGAAVIGWHRLWQRPPRWIANLGSQAKPFSLVLLVAVSMYSLLTFGPTVSAVRAWQRVTPAERLKAKEIGLLAATFPNASTLAGYSALPSFAARAQVYAAHYAFLGKRQYSERDYPLPADLNLVVLDAQDFVTYQLQFVDAENRKNDYASGAARFRRLLEDRDLMLTDVTDTLLTFQRAGADRLSEFVQRTPQPPLSGIEFALQAELLLDIEGQAILRVHGQVGNPSLPNVQVRLNWLAAKGKKLETRLLPLGYGLVPTSTWQLGEVVTTTFVLTPPMNAHMVTLEAIAPSGHLQLNGWRAAEPVLDSKTRGVSSTITLPLER